jgi:hypothetical protein
MKTTLIAVALCVALLPLLALAQGAPPQSKHSLGANAELSIPVGEFSDVAELGYGGNVKYQYRAMPEGAFTLTAGYLTWGEKDLTSLTSIQAAAFNFMLGGKFFISEGFYGSVEGGIYFLEYEYTGNYANQLGNTDRFMLPIGLGYEKSGFEVGARYMLLDTELPAFSLTVGYNFGL